MSDWLKIHPKVASAGIVAALLYYFAPVLQAHGIALDPALMSVLAGYLTPSE